MSVDNSSGRAALRKATLYLIPFLFLLYIISFLDRVNVGFAALQMNEDLGFSHEPTAMGTWACLRRKLMTIPRNIRLHDFSPTAKCTQVCPYSKCECFIRRHLTHRQRSYAEHSVVNRASRGYPNKTVCSRGRSLRRVPGGSIPNYTGGFPNG